MKKEQLEKQLEDLKKELSSLRVAKVTGGNPSKMAKMSVTTSVAVSVKRSQIAILFGNRLLAASQ